MDQANFPEAQWVLAGGACAILGVDRMRLAKLCAQGILTRRQIPGAQPRYNVAELRRLAERSTQPAA